MSAVPGKIDAIVLIRGIRGPFRSDERPLPHTRPHSGAGTALFRAMGVLSIEACNPEEQSPGHNEKRVDRSARPRRPGPGERRSSAHGRPASPRRSAGRRPACARPRRTGRRRRPVRHGSRSPPRPGDELRGPLRDRAFTGTASIGSQIVSLLSRHATHRSSPGRNPVMTR